MSVSLTNNSKEQKALDVASNTLAPFLDNTSTHEAILKTAMVQERFINEMKKAFEDTAVKKLQLKEVIEIMESSIRSSSLRQEAEIHATASTIETLDGEIFLTNQQIQAEKSNNTLLQQKLVQANSYEHALPIWAAHQAQLKAVEEERQRQQARAAYEAYIKKGGRPQLYGIDQGYENTH